MTDPAEYYEAYKATHEVVELRHPRAQKSYVCDGCGRTIEVGQRYWNRIFRFRRSRAKPHGNEHYCEACGAPAPRIRVVK